jgi:mannose-6-phosphate isomerase
MIGPLRFQPLLKPMVWGGRLLAERLGKSLPTADLYGESWDVSDHVTHSSMVAGGQLSKTTLRDLMARRRRELLGPAAPAHEIFPWLVKHLDAHELLSVQVHPDDAQATKLRPGERGKTEVWFILEARPGSRVYAGLLPGTDEKALRAALANGTVAQCLHSFEPRPGDCVFLPAGTVHAVGGGVLMAEIQQTSDVTFRLFDWNRRDARGQARALHVEEAMASIHWDKGPVQPVPAKAFAAGSPPGRQVLAASQYFHLEFRRENAPFDVGGADRLRLVLPVAGGGTLTTPDGMETVAIGQAWLIPASCPIERCTPEGSLAYLLCTLP